MRDVKESDLRALLRFIYHGEVQLEESRLAEFLKTADTLQIQGLADGAASAIPSDGISDDDDEIEEVKGDKSETNSLRKLRRRRPDPYDDLDGDDEKQVRWKVHKPVFNVNIFVMIKKIGGKMTGKSPMHIILVSS